MRTLIEFARLRDRIETGDDWMASLIPQANEDYWSAKDFEGRFTHQVHEECQLLSFMPSGDILCPGVGVTDTDYNAYIKRKGERGFQKDEEATIPATLTTHSIKFRMLISMMTEHLQEYRNGVLWPRDTRLIIFCDHEKNLSIMKFFMCNLDMDFTEISRLEDFKSGRCRNLLASSREVNTKLTGTDGEYIVVVMDVVPAKVLYKIADAVPGAVIKVLLKDKSHDIAMVSHYFEKAPNRGGRVDIRWSDLGFRSILAASSEVCKAL